MARTHPPILMIDRGDLPSLAAALIQPDPSRLVLWHHETTRPGARRRREMVDLHRQLFGARAVVAVTAPAGHADDAGLTPALELILAAITARRLGCERIVWPVQAGPDPARVEAAVERATLVSELAAIDGDTEPPDTEPPDSEPPKSEPPESEPPALELPDLEPPHDGRPRSPELAFDLPLVDLEDDQVIDLADDGGAAPEAFWPCSTDGREPCGTCPGCVRWSAAYGFLGRPEPLRPVL